MHGVRFDSPGLGPRRQAVAAALLALLARRAAGIELVREPVRPAPVERKPMPARGDATPSPPVDPKTAPAPEPSRAARAAMAAPKLAVGDSWEFVYSRNTRRAASVGTTFTETIASGGPREFTLSSGARLVASPLAFRNRVSSGKTVREFRPHGLSIRFPLIVGKAWRDDYEMRDPDPASKFAGRVRAGARADRAEVVTVPAGTFETMVVEHEWTYEDSHGVRETGRRKVWYSEDAAFWVRFEYETSDAKGERIEAYLYELKRFTRAR